MKTPLLLALLALAAGANAQVVDSGFEAWTGGLPDGWFGLRTNIEASGVEQVTDNVHGGTSAVRLTRTESGHQRFSTTSVPVTDGTIYTVSFWVRGTGNIRVGLYDGRTLGFGYAPYSDYTAATATWTQVTRTVVAVNTASDAEFILSVQSTGAPEHIVVDDVVIEEAGMVPVLSIHDIQFTSSPDGNSPHMDEVVKTSGIVTAVDLLTNSGEPQLVYYLQDVTGAWNGVYVYDFDDSGNNVEIGDEVELTATVTEYFNLTELNDIVKFEVVSTGQTLPEPLVVQTGEVASEALESVLVKVVNAECTEVPSGANFGKWKADDGSGFAVVGKEMYTTTPAPLLEQLFDVTGVVSFGFDEYNLQPRAASDIQLATSIGELAGATVTLFPNPASNELTLDLGTLSGRTEYTMTDASGRVVLADVATALRSSIDVSALSNGLYVVALRNGDATMSTRVQVQR